jgi:hypothetical protein
MEGSSWNTIISAVVTKEKWLPGLGDSNAGSQGINAIFNNVYLSSPYFSLLNLSTHNFQTSNKQNRFAYLTRYSRSQRPEVQDALLKEKRSSVFMKPTGS